MKTKKNIRKETPTKSYTFYIAFNGEGKTVQEAFEDGVLNSDLTEIPTPELSANSLENIMDDLNGCGISAVENPPEED